MAGRKYRTEQNLEGIAVCKSSKQLSLYYVRQHCLVKKNPFFIKAFSRLHPKHSALGLGSAQILESRVGLFLLLTLPYPQL